MHTTRQWQQTERDASKNKTNRETTTATTTKTIRTPKTSTTTTLPTITTSNSGMAMASLQVPHDATAYKERCSAFWILGQVYRRIGPIQNQDKNPRCLQTYFYDVEM